MSAAVAPGDQPDGGGQPGRRRATSQAELEHVAFDLFEANGFGGQGSAAAFQGPHTTTG